MDNNDYDDQNDSISDRDDFLDRAETPERKSKGIREKVSELTKRPWTVEEDELLRKIVVEQGAANWTNISKDMTDIGYKRLGKQCRERWFNHLDPTVSKDPWNQDEDALIIELHRQHGNKWTEFTRHLPGRPANSIKNHWNSTLRRRLGEMPTTRKRKGDGDSAEDTPPVKRRRGRQPKIKAETSEAPSEPLMFTEERNTDDSIDSELADNMLIDTDDSLRTSVEPPFSRSQPQSIPAKSRVVQHGISLYLLKDGTLSFVPDATAVPLPHFHVAPELAYQTLGDPDGRYSSYSDEIDDSSYFAQQFFEPHMPNYHASQSQAFNEQHYAEDYYGSSLEDSRDAVYQSTEFPTPITQDRDYDFPALSEVTKSSWMDTGY